MGFLICLFCVTFVQITFGQIATNGRQNSFNAFQLPFTNTNTRGFSKSTRDVANGLPAGNRIVKNTANNGNNFANAANTVFANANANVASINQATANVMYQNNPGNVNINPTVMNNLANLNVPFTTSKSMDPNLVNANLSAQTSASNLAVANIANLGANYANLGFSGPNHIRNYAHPNIANQMYQPTISANQISGNGPYTTRNTVNPNNRNNDLFRLKNPNLASGPTGNLPGQAVTNFANGNIANVAVNPENGFTNGFNFAIDGNPFTVVSGLPGNQPLDIHVASDALQISGTVSIAGKMPIFGTVALNGNLPSEGMASVNYACTSQRNI